MTDRHRSAVDGGRPLGLGDPGLKVGGLTYYVIKRRLGLIPPTTGGVVDSRQREFVGLGDPYIDVDAVGRRRGWHSADDVIRHVAREDEEREAAVRGIRWVLDLGDMREELTV